MTIVELGLIFGFGLLSSLHCAQMCGPIVLAYSLGLPRGAALAHACYNGGRILTYTALGAIAGAGGGLLSLAFAQAAAIVAGALMMVAGLALLGLVPKNGLVRIGGASGFTRLAGRLLRSPSPRGKLALGLVLGFLPCGLLYAALLKAVESGTAASGALTMLAFGAGTAASLVAIGVFSTSILRRAGRWSNRIAAVSVIVAGAFVLWRGLFVAVGQAGCHHAAH